MQPDSSTPARFISRFLDSIRAHQDSIAIVDQDGQRPTTYGELYTLACRVAAYLRQRAFQPHTFIAVSLPPSAEYVAAELGIWLAGHAAVPLSETFPAARVSSIMSHCDSPLLIDEAAMDDILAATDAACVPAADAYPLPAGDDVMILFYTSGSTGTPKGVIHTFLTFDFSHFILDTLGNLKPLVMGFNQDMSFAASVYLYATLLVGGRAIIVPPSILRDVHRLEAFYNRNPITFAVFTPSLLKQFHPRHSALRLVLTASERLSGIAPEGYRLLNIYGMTETGEACFMFDVDRAYDNTPIGRPTRDHFEYCVLDDDMREVAPNEEGELCLRGRLSPGYYKDPERSAALWRGGWLHTGDTVRLDSSGNLIYVNRKDWLAKINGQRVEPGEVEAALRQADGVSDAVVKAFTTPTRQFLCAYYTATADISADTLRAHLATLLPSYMVPAFFMRVDSFPLLPNNKLDRVSLPSPLAAGPSDRPPYVAPVTSAERQLCDAFARTLGISDIGADDDFMALGGDSIRLMEVQAFCPSLPLSTDIIYRYRTPRRIAAAVSRHQAAATVSEPSASAGQEYYPLSQAQLGIFAASMARQGQAVYNNGRLYRLAPHVDTCRLCAACEAVVKAHRSLLTRLTTDAKGTPLQHIPAADDFHIRIERLSDADFERLKRQLIQPFDLLADRLFRLRLFLTPGGCYLFLDVHHVIFDGSSLDIFLSDLDLAYSGKPVAGETWTAFDAAADEQRRRHGEDYRLAAAWHKAAFSTLDIDSLPPRDCYDAATTYGQQHCVLSTSYDHLEASCQHLGVTPNVLTTAVFGFLLGTVTYARESLFATIYNGRKDLRSQHTIAMMVRTLAVHTHWDTATTVMEYVADVKHHLLEGMHHDLFSFVELSALNHHVNSAVLFAYQGRRTAAPVVGGAPVTPLPLTFTATGEALQVELFHDGSALTLHTEYHSHRYSDAMVRTLQKLYDHLLQLFTTPGLEHRPLSSLPLVHDDELQRLRTLGDGSRQDRRGTPSTRLPADGDSASVVSLFRQSAALHPDAVAVVCQEQRLTYRELDEATDRLARYLLLHYGLQPRQVVGVMTRRSLLMVIYPLAILKAGGAYMPLDHRFPADRLANMCSDGDVSLILSEGNLLAGVLPTFTGHVITGHDDLPDLDAKLPAPRPDDLFTVLYTSGTTGRPKGVPLVHSGIVNLCHWYASECRLTTADRVMAYSNFSFDAHLLDLYPALSVGASVYVIPTDLRLDLHCLNSYMEQQHITVGFFTTQVGHLFATTVANQSLRLLAVGGEKLPPLSLPRYKLYNIYGPTECTVASAFYPVVQPFGSRQFIGRPPAGYQLWVVSPDLQPLPCGVNGELVIGGVGVTPGYLHPSAADAARFVTLDGCRCYRTGDLARWAPDGNLEFLGRRDGQVKLRGLRIELGEIEQRALQHPLVSQAVACVKTVGSNQVLCLYYSTGDAEVSQGELRQFLAGTLADYMVPTALVKVYTLPLTPNGKINLAALPAPTPAHTVATLPSSASEQAVSELVGAELQLTAFGVTDNLLAFGFSSLSAMKLCAAIHDRLGCTLRATDVMRHPTVRAIASLLSPTTDSREPHIEPQPYYPLMDQQLGLYLEWEKHRESTRYNIPCLWHFNNVSAEAAVRALRATIDAHPYLKSRLAVTDGRTMLCRHDEQVVDIGLLSADRHPADDFFFQRVRPFNLLGGPLCRFLVVAARQDVSIFMDVHHIIFDGFSVRLFHDDLQRALNGTLPADRDAAAFDYALCSARRPEPESMTTADGPMLPVLQAATALVWPSCGAPDGVPVGIVRMPFGSSAISRFCGTHRVTVNSFMHAVFLLVAERLTRVSRPLYLTITGGRSADVSLLSGIGMFVRTLAVTGSTEPIDPLTPAAFVQDVQERLLLGYSSVTQPFTQLVPLLHPRPEVMFIYQGGLYDEAQADGGELSSFVADAPKFPLSLVTAPDGDGYVLTIEYDGTRYNRSSMQLLAHAFSCAAEGLVTLATVGDVPLTTAAEQARLLTLGSGAPLDDDTADTVVALFRRQAAARPEAIAVADKRGTMTYAGLDVRSDALARRLIARGVSEGSFVAVMMPRRREFVVAVMAVLKAGGAYVPLDSNNPRQRLLFMLGDARADVLLTTAELLADTFPADSLPPATVPLLMDLEDDDTGPATDDLDDTPPIGVDNSRPDALAYMIYTSGSTGQPKGVMVEHSSLAAFASWRRRLLQLTPADRCALHASFSFDASLDDLITPLTAGAQVHVIGDAVRHDLRSLERYIADHGITGLTLTTPLGLAMLADSHLPLRYLMLGGEQMARPRLDAGSPTVINGYGPTEFTVCATLHVVDPRRSYDTIPIGRPVPGSTALIVDSAGHLVPQGLAGELCLLGPQLARGYWQHDELTAKAFTPCRYLAGQRMYHTSDIARWNDRGELEFLGRNDLQVKVNGYRIELLEVEQRLCACDGVTAAAAFVVSQGQTAVLAACYEADRPVAPDALGQRLRHHLPDYMVPQVLMQLPKLPTTPNGKTDRQALQAHYSTLSHVRQSGRVEPADSKERLLCRLVSDVLGTEQFGVTDDLTLHGLSSLSALRLAAAAADSGLRLKVNDILRLRTVRRLASLQQAVGTWCDEGFHSRRPVVAVVQGFTSRLQLEPLLDELSRHCSVFVIEPVEEHFVSLGPEATLSTLTVLYTRLLASQLPRGTSVSAFLGHSFGGELAYRCATVWARQTGEHPTVVLLDTYYPTSHATPTAGLTPAMQRIMQQLAPGATPPEPYDGQVLLLKAADCELPQAGNGATPDAADLVRLSHDSEQAWQRLNPQTEVTTVAAGHLAMLEPQFLNKYIAFIRQKLSL